MQVDQNEMREGYFIRCWKSFSRCSKYWVSFISLCILSSGVLVLFCQAVSNQEFRVNSMRETIDSISRIVEKYETSSSGHSKKEIFDDIQRIRSRTNSLEAVEGHLGPLKVAMSSLILMIIVGSSLAVGPLQVAHKIRKLRSGISNNSGDVERDYDNKPEVIAGEERNLRQFILLQFIPFGILALSLTFSYEEIISGGFTSAAAIASVMILFLLAELGTHIIAQSGRAETAAFEIQRSSRKIAEAQGAIRDGVEAAGSYLKLVEAGINPNQDRENRRGDDRYLGKRLLDLVGTCSKRVTDSSGSYSPRLLRILFQEFFKEIHEDFSGRTEPYRIPRSVTTPEGSKGKAIYVATNFGFYVSFLSSALEGMRRQINAISPDDKVPCIATVTNHLPTHFWTSPHDWDDDSILRHADADLESYRESLNRFVTNKRYPGRVFRAVLVADDDDVNNINRVKSADFPLWPAVQWEWEKGWVIAATSDESLIFSTSKNGHDNVNFGSLRSREGKGVDIGEFLSVDDIEESGFRESKKTAEVEKDAKMSVSLRRYQVLRPSLKEWLRRRKSGEDGHFICFDDDKNDRNDIVSKIKTDYENCFASLKSASQDSARFGDHFVDIRRLFRLNMHPNQSSGSSYIIKCSQEQFKNNFGGRPDILFLGCCDRSARFGRKKIWEAEEDALGLEWSLVMMASMSPKSQTMFLTILYDSDSIKALWKSTKEGVQGLLDQKIDAI